MLGYTLINKIKLEKLRVEARQHRTLKEYTDSKIRDLNETNNKLLEENQRYRAAIRQMTAAFNSEKQKQQYGSISNFQRKMSTKIKELVTQFHLD